MLTKYVSIVRVLFMKQGAKYLSAYHPGASYVVQWERTRLLVQETQETWL